MSDPFLAALAAYLERKLDDQAFLIELRSQGYSAEGAQEQLQAMKDIREAKDDPTP